MREIVITKLDLMDVYENILIKVKHDCSHLDGFSK